KPADQLQSDAQVGFGEALLTRFRVDKPLASPECQICERNLRRQIAQRPEPVQKTQRGRTFGQVGENLAKLLLRDLNALWPCFLFGWKRFDEFFELQVHAFSSFPGFHRAERRTFLVTDRSTPACLPGAAIRRKANGRRCRGTASSRAASSAPLQ